MSIEDDDEQTHLLHTCACGAELERPPGQQFHDCAWCGAEYDNQNRRIWPDDPLRDLQDM